MLKRADALKASQLISDEDLGRAVELKRRMDDAQKVLADKWKPVQDDLAKLGTNYHESWVGITERLAQAVGFATDLYSTLKLLPDALAAAGNASFWQKLTDATGAMGLNSRPDGLILKDEPGFGDQAAQEKLRAALQNHANITKAMREAQDVSSAVRGDTSKAPAKQVEEIANAYDNATASLEKHLARLQADTGAVGLGAAAQAQLRAEAQLTTAAMQAYGKVSADTAADIKDISARVGEAAAAFEKAKVASAIEFNQKTALFTQEDVSIARTLAGVYGNDVEAALRSTDAPAIKFQVK